MEDENGVYLTRDLQAVIGILTAYKFQIQDHMNAAQLLVVGVPFLAFRHSSPTNNSGPEEMLAPGSVDSGHFHQSTKGARHHPHAIVVM